MAAVVFTIEVAPVTKKNSNQIIKVRGRAMLVPSKRYRMYETAATPFCPYELIDYPVNIEAHYYMPTRRRVDITNLESALMDTLVHAGTIKDDNCAIVVSTDGSRVHYDKENPRTEVIITPSVEVEREFIKSKVDKG